MAQKPHVRCGRAHQAHFKVVGADVHTNYRKYLRCFFNVSRDVVKLPKKCAWRPASSLFFPLKYFIIDGRRGANVVDRCAAWA